MNITVRIRSTAVAGALALGLSATALQPVIQELAAQSARSTVTQPEPKRPGDHRIRYLLTGVGIGGLLALGYYKMSDGGKQSGRCEPWNCALPYLTISGGIAGLFFAQEAAARRRAELPRAGDALTFRFTEVGLPAAASAIDVSDSIVAFATDSGAQVLNSASRSVPLRRRGAGLSNLRSVAIGTPAASTEPRLFIGTGTALWETPLTTGLLARVMDGPVDALGAHADVVVAAFGSTVRIRHTVNGVARLDSVDAGQAITAARYDAVSRGWWLTSDSALFELTVTDAAPTLVQRATFTGVARAVASSPSWVAVALGSDGLAIWPRTSLGGGVITPIVLRGEPRFAFDLAFLGDDLFVAGGVDGVTRVQLSPGARVVGSSRQAGYATTIVADDGALWVGDRSRNRVLRIVP